MTVVAIAINNSNIHRPLSGTLTAALGQPRPSSKGPQSIFQDLSSGVSGRAVPQPRPAGMV